MRKIGLFVMSVLCAYLIQACPDTEKTENDYKKERLDLIYDLAEQRAITHEEREQLEKAYHFESIDYVDRHELMHVFTAMYARQQKTLVGRE